MIRADLVSYRLGAGGTGQCMVETIIEGLNTIAGITSRNGKLKLGDGICLFCPFCLFCPKCLGNRPIYRFKKIKFRQKHVPLVFFPFVPSVFVFRCHATLWRDKKDTKDKKDIKTRQKRQLRQQRQIRQN